MQHHDYVLVVVRNLQEASDDDYVKALRKQGYRVELVPPGEDPIPIMATRPPIAACFQFDYPDLQGLTDLRHAKQQVPSVPLLMITQAHSEHLAVWAFRCRVWDYFVHPIDMPRFLAVLDSLRHAQLTGNPSPSSNANPEPIGSLDSQNAIPHEARLRCPPPENGRAHIDRALTFIDKNLHRKIAQSEVAESCHLSTFQFSRLFKRLTGSTFQDYVLHRRITEAKRLLANPKVSITDVCFTVGFSDLSYFTRTFQRYVGQPPSRYRVGMTDSLFSPSTPPRTAHQEEKITSIERHEVPEPDIPPYRS